MHGRIHSDQGPIWGTFDGDMTTEAHRVQRVPTSAEEIRLAREELERILTNVHFQRSSRYPAMLRYVVEQALAGKQAELKERTIGIEVFGRDPGYDTNSEPVVRFSAGEIRKRLAQIYAEDPHPPKVRFELPLGAYVPLFWWEPEEAEPAGTEPDSSPEEAAPEPDAPSTPDRPAVHRRAWRRIVFACAVGIPCILAAIFVPGWITGKHNAVAALWKPLLQQNAPVVLVVGQPSAQSSLPTTNAQTSINQHLVQSNFSVSIPTAHVIAEIGGFLKSKQKTLDLHGADATTLSDVYDKPVVLAGAMDNKWTLKLLKSMPFSFASAGKISYIKDSSRPAFRKWQLNFTEPYMKQNVDYAILARFVSPVTNAPILVIAGLGGNGNEAAAGYALHQNDLRSVFKRAPKNWKGFNFEAVLRVNVIGGDTGSATVVASTFWNKTVPHIKRHQD